MGLSSHQHLLTEQGTSDMMAAAARHDVRHQHTRQCSFASANRFAWELKLLEWSLPIPFQSDTVCCCNSMPV